MEITLESNIVLTLMGVFYFLTEENENSHVEQSKVKKKKKVKAKIILNILCSIIFLLLCCQKGTKAQKSCKNGEINQNQNMIVYKEMVHIPR